MKGIEIENGYALRLDKGDEVMSCLQAFVKELNIASASLFGIGALKDVTLGYYELEQKNYTKRVFDGEYELLSLLGNVSYAENEPIVHLHCQLGREDFSVFGGHFFSGTVAVTGEIWLMTSTTPLIRTMHPDFDLNLLAI